MLVALIAAQFINAYDTSSMTVAMANIADDLSTTLKSIQVAITTYSLVMAAGMITGSKLADIFGGKKVFRVGVLTFGLGALIAAVSPTFGFLFLGWSLLEGIGSCLMIPAMYALVAVNFASPRSRAAAFAGIASMQALGGVLGPLVGGLITTTITWRASFGMEVLIVIGAVFLARGIRDFTLQGPRPKLDVGGAVLSAIGLALIVGGVLLASTYGWVTTRKAVMVGGHEIIPEGGPSPTLIFVAAGILFMAGFVFYVRLRERRGKEPLIHLSQFRRRSTNAGLPVLGGQFFNQAGVVFIMSTFILVSLEYSALKTGVVLSAAAVGVLLSSRRAGRLSERFSPKRVIQAGFLAVVVGVAILGFTVNTASSGWQFAPGLFLFGIGLGLVGPTIVNLVQSSAPERDQNEVSGLSRSAANLGASLGTAVAGAVLIGTIITGITRLTQESQVVPPDLKTQIEQKLQGDVSAVSNTQVQQWPPLQGQPPEVVQAVVDINASARDEALHKALIVVGVLGLLGLGTSVFLPKRAVNPEIKGEVPGLGI